jgi:hypothetical protein
VNITRLAKKTTQAEVTTIDTDNGTFAEITEFHEARYVVKNSRYVNHQKSVKILN